MECRESIRNLEQQLKKQIIGQEKLVERLLLAMLADGHLLVEGAPGLAKTRAIKCLGDGIEGDFHRIQFTPDLLPGDLTGTDIYRPEDGSFRFQAGPVFHNLVLADEINRAPAKVQSALLEAMAERQVTIGRESYRLPDLFLVMATQNPIEQEGTYPLPEAQLDRFLMHVNVDYPSASAERKILELARDEEASREGITKIVVTQAEVFAARKEIQSIHMSQPVEEYIVQLIMASRFAGRYSQELAGWIEYGGSPRATIALDRCSRALAWLRGSDFVSPGEVQEIVHDVLRHRLILSFEAEANGISRDQVIDTILKYVPVS